MFFAEELPLSPIVPSQAVTIVIVFSVVMFLLNFAGAILIFVMASRRKPSIDSEFSTKKESQAAMAALRAEMHREIAGLTEKIDQLNTRNEVLANLFFEKVDKIVLSFDTGMREVHRAIGRLEGGK